MFDIMSHHKLLSLNCIFFYTKKGDYVEMRVGKAAMYKEVTQACYLAMMDADRASSSEDADGDNDDDAESLALFRE